MENHIPLVSGNSSNKNLSKQNYRSSSSNNNKQILLDPGNNVFLNSIAGNNNSARTGARPKAFKQRPQLNSSDLGWDQGRGNQQGGSGNQGSARKSQKGMAVSLNHLLNFSFPERQSGGVGSGNGGGKQPRHQPAFNKERFVNANFRFVVRPEFDEDEHLANPDMIVKWEHVTQMVIPASEPASCPICLCEPTAPRVAKCGHLFCMPCVQHYIALSEHSWRKCPICFESIYAAALKPVAILSTTAHDPAQLGPSNAKEIEFTLMRRDIHSTISLPIISYRKWKSLIPSVDLVSAMTFSKFMTASPVYLKSLLSKDVEDLRTLLKEIGDLGGESYESSYIEISLDLLEKEIEVLEEAIKIRKSIDRPVFHPAEDAESFYFYQAADGQHLYLHPLDIKVLKQEFGSYQDFPSHIKLPIIAIRESTVNGDLRKRCKYLSHLPLSCDVSFSEVDMSSVVSAPTLAMFNLELSERMERMLRLEQEKRDEELLASSRRSRSPVSSARNSYANSPQLMPASQYEYQYSSAEEFGPPLSSSPENQHGTASGVSSNIATPSKSFANMAMSAPSSSSWGRVSGFASRGTSSAWPSLSGGVGGSGLEEQSSTGWKLEIPDDILSAVSTTPSSESALSGLINGSAAANGGTLTSPSKSTGSGKKKKTKFVLLSYYM